MPISNFPQGFAHGVNIRGIPVLNTYSGNVFWVDSVNGSNGNKGTFDRPFATIDYAIGRCTANQGDIIMVKAGHTESLTTAGQIAMDVAGVTVMGLGVGHTRPKLVYDNASGSVTITASNVRWSNIVHEASIASITNGIIADDGISHVELDNLRFTFDATGVEFTVMVKLGNGATDSADYVDIHDCWFEAENIDGCGSAILIDDCDNVHIRSNLFTGDFNSVALDGAAASSACKDYVITDNYFLNADTGATIDLDDAATGIAFNNRIAGGAALASNVDWGNVRTAENYVTDAADVSGVIIPAATAS